MRLSGALVGIFLAISMSTAPICAQETVEGLSAAQLFRLADTRKAAGAIDDALAIYDALSNDADSDIRAEARYRKGLMLADLGRFADAAVEFRALLDEKPDVLAARLELARMLAALGREKDARRELRQAQAIGIPADAAPAVDQFARALRSPERFGGSFELALAPDSNVNRATQARTLDTIIAPLTLSEDARAQSGIGIRTAGQAFAKIRMTDQLSLLPRLAGVANLYRDTRFNDISASALVGIEWQGTSDRVNWSVGKTYRWYGGKRYAQTRTVTVDWLRPIDKRSQIVATGSASEARYDRNALQDGAIYDLAVSYERALTASAGVTVTGSATRQTARDPGYATWAAGVRFGGWQEIGIGTVFVSTGMRRTVGDERLFLFPERRRDWLLTTRAGVNLRALSIAGFAPTIRVNLERNFSTVGIYDYRRIATEFGITRAF